jgi:archaellum component FlaC
MEKQEVGKSDISLLDYVKHIKERFGNQRIVDDYSKIVAYHDHQNKVINELEEENRKLKAKVEWFEEHATPMCERNSKLMRHVNSLDNRLRDYKRVVKFLSKDL